MTDTDIFWKIDTFGLTLYGKEYRFNDERYYCFDKNTHLVLLDVTENNNVRDKAETFFREKGYEYIYICGRRKNTV